MNEQGKHGRLIYVVKRVEPYHIARFSQLSRVATVYVLCESIGSLRFCNGNCDVADIFLEKVDRGVSAPTVAARILERIAPTVILAPAWSFLLSVVAVRWGLSRGCPIIILSDSQASDHRRFPLWEWVKSRFLVGCHGAIVGGTRHRDYLVALGVPSTRCMDGYDVVDNDYFLRARQRFFSKRKLLRKSFRLPEKYFLTVARMIEKKNLAFLIQSFRDFSNSFDCGLDVEKKMHLVIVGDGPLRSELEKIVKANSLQELVCFLGYQDYRRIAIIYSLAVAFVLASKTEQWGLVVNEAMASGLPVIVSKAVGCSTELVRPGENGFIFDPNSAGSLIEVMRTMASDAEGLKRMGRCSSEIICSWSTKRFVSSFMFLRSLNTPDDKRNSPVLDRLLRLMLQVFFVLYEPKQR